MVYKYVVILKNLNNRYIDWFGLLLSVISAVFFARELTLSNKVGVAYLIGLVFVVGMVIYNLAQSSRKKKVYYSRALLIAALVWMKMPYLQWLAFVFIIFVMLSRNLAQVGSLSPLIAAWVPSTVFTVIGLALYRFVPK